MRQLPERRGLRAAIDLLQSVYGTGDAGALHDAYIEAQAVSWLLRLTLPVLERAYPVRRLLGFAAKLETCIAEQGLHLGCRSFFSDVSIPWELHISESTAQISERAPVIFFGNHPSLFTPFLAAACVAREDFRFFSSKYVCHLLPSIAQRAFAIEVPMTHSWTEWRRGGWQRALVYRLISLLHPMPSVEDVRSHNHESLVRGADYIRNGGSAIICPGGGGKLKDRKWFSGIGSLVRQLQDSPGNQTIYLVPFREENSSNKRIYAHVQNGPISRLKRSLVYRGPLRIRFGDPIPLSEVGTPDSTLQQLVDRLKAHYDSLFLDPLSMLG